MFNHSHSVPVTSQKVESDSVGITFNITNGIKIGKNCCTFFYVGVESGCASNLLQLI